MNNMYRLSDMYESNLYIIYEKNAVIKNFIFFFFCPRNVVGF